MKKIAIIFLSMTFTISLFSQQMREKIEEKVKIQRIAFLTHLVADRNGGAAILADFQWIYGQNAANP